MAFNSLSELRSSRGNFDNLMKEVEKIGKPEGGSNSRDDDRFWQPEVDKSGNGYAVIRFLPPPKGEELPWVRIWNHGFQGPTGKWYIENSLTTIGKPDPVSELNNELWNSGSEASKEVARKQKRKLSYICNVLIISDSKHPENEGKVKLFKFGKKIFDKIKDVMQPQFEDEAPVNPFDFWKGANFKLKIRNVEGYRNYDKSEFDATAALSEDDAEIEKVWNAQHSLQSFLDAGNFKSYEELKKKLDGVLSGASAAVARAEKMDLDEDTPAVKAVAKAAPKAAVEEEDDESLSYFAKLAADD
jgi:O6-methylguanine-DNA--protein-cysteine methyltransferase